MADIEKYSQLYDIKELVKHYARENYTGNYRNKELNTELSYLNYNIAPDRGTWRQTVNYMNRTIKKYTPKMRKDGVKMCDWVITKPKRISEDMEKIFFQETYNFLVDRYGSKSGLGEDIVLSAFVMKDETTPHIHFCFMPLLEKDGKPTFCAKDLINHKELQSFHQDLERYLVEKHICQPGDINSGITKASGGNRSIRELKRETRQKEHEHEHSRWDYLRGNSDRNREERRW